MNFVRNKLKINEQTSQKKTSSFHRVSTLYTKSPMTKPGYILISPPRYLRSMILLQGFLTTCHPIQLEIVQSFNPLNAYTVQISSVSKSCFSAIHFTNAHTFATSSLIHLKFYSLFFNLPQSQLSGLNFILNSILQLELCPKIRNSHTSIQSSNFTEK